MPIFDIEHGYIFGDDTGFSLVDKASIFVWENPLKIKKSEI